MSVPHRVSMVAGMIVPSWLRGPRGGPVRDGASRSCSRISRNTRRSEVRMPFRRRRAQASDGLHHGTRSPPGQRGSQR